MVAVDVAALAPLGAFVTAVTAAITGGIALVRTGRMEAARLKVDRDASAFTAMQTTVTTLRDEVDRIAARLTAAEAKLIGCEDARAAAVLNLAAAQLRVAEYERASELAKAAKAKRAAKIGGPPS